MTTATPPAQTPRVRPLWERHQLFREPQYENNSPWSNEDDTDDEVDS